MQRLRFNPTPCNCPPFEIALDGHWHRVAFEAPEDSPLMQALQQATKQDDARRRTFALRGSLDDDLEVCAKGAIFLKFEPTAWDDAAVAPDTSTCHRNTVTNANRRFPLWLGATLLVGAWAISPPAAAKSTFLNKIPNTPGSCMTCHTSTLPAAWNPFGLDVRAT